jgi:hypothetical protein
MILLKAQFDIGPHGILWTWCILQSDDAQGESGRLRGRRTGQLIEKNKVWNSCSLLKSTLIHDFEKSNQYVERRC